MTSPSRTKAPGSWHRRRAAAQRTRHVLATIFFPADEPARGWVLTVIAVIASVAAILRLGSNGMNTLWAEDGQIFYGEAMHSYVHAFFQSYYGYWQATPRIIAAVVVLFPVSWNAAIKLSSVVTDLHGVTGRDIMDHLIAGERNPKVLAQLARARARRKISELEAALEGAEFFTPQLAALLARMLARIDQLNASIGELTAVVETLLEPYEEQLQQAESMPGWGRRSAQDAVAETGVDMTRFRTGGHLASWAGRTPLDNQSGSRSGRAKSKKGNRYLAAITGETAVAAGKTQTREGARYRRIARRRGKPKAGVALGNTQLKVYHALLSSPGTRYQDLGVDYYDNRASTRRQVRALQKRASELGYTLVPDLTGCPEIA